MTYMTQTAPAAPLFERFAALRNWREARAKRQLFRRTLRELSALTDRELADLAIARANLRAVAHESVYG